MPEVSGRTLVMAIQAVDEEIHRLEEERTALGEEGDPDLDELLLAYSLAADELEKAYREALQHVSNLPPYEQLVGRRRSGG